jgi:hypothetical protein
MVDDRPEPCYACSQVDGVTPLRRHGLRNCSIGPRCRLWDALVEGRRSDSCRTVREDGPACIERVASDGVWAVRHVESSAHWASVTSVG